MMTRTRDSIKKGSYGKTLCLLFLALTLLVAGCSDNDDDDTSSGTTASAVPGSTPAPDTGTTKGGASAAATGGSNIPSSGIDIGTAGILWKPVSEGNGLLVVLLPTHMGAPGAKILHTNGTLIDTGAYYGSPAEHGSRAIYRFGNQGCNFPAPCLLQVGGTVYEVPNPCSRYN